METYTFYHGTRADPAVAQQSFAQGAQPQGKGYGGQKTGFYILTSQDAARRHARDFLEQEIFADQEKRAGPPLVVQIKTDFKSSEWDIDYEQHASEVLALLGAHRSLFGEIIGQPFSYLNTQNQTETFCVKGLHDFGPGGGFKIADGARRRGFGFTRAPDDEGTVGDAPILQAIADHFSAIDPDFASARQQLMLDLATKPGSALKYVGTSPLAVKGMEVFESGTWNNLPLPPRHPSLPQNRQDLRL
ncbi:MAG: hypothetical protein WDO70_08800 [Alphaproteobacteria bacterium]